MTDRHIAVSANFLPRREESFENSLGVALAISGVMRHDIDRFEKRTKSYAVATIRLCADLERVPGLRFVSDQLARSSGSVAANHRAMRRARSTREFAAKLQIVNEEVDESVLWFEIVDEICTNLRSRVSPLLSEGLELRAMFARARATTRKRLKKAG